MNSDLVIILPGQRRVKLCATHPLSKQEIRDRELDWNKELEWVKYTKDLIAFSRYETPLPRKPPEHTHHPS